MSSSIDSNKTKKPKNFHKRVEDFKLWKDDKTFQEQEYERRRQDKIKTKGIIKSDSRLQKCRKLYIPAIAIIIVGSLVLVGASIDDISGNTLLSKNRLLFQILGIVVGLAGIIMLMVVAVYTYNREDKVRAENGFPSLFEASLTGTRSSSLLKESFILQSEFVDRRSSYCPSTVGKSYSRMTSYDSDRSVSFYLGESFSSSNAAVAWVRNHSLRFQRSNSLPRRQNSDTALDQSMARERLMAWQNHLNQNPETKQNREDDAVTSDTSQTILTTSTTSSGYHSNVSSPSCLPPEAVTTDLSSEKTTVQIENPTLSKFFTERVNSALEKQSTDKYAGPITIIIEKCTPNSSHPDSSFLEDTEENCKPSDAILTMCS